MTEILREAPSGADLPSGTVLRKLLGHYHVATPGGVVVCSLSSKLRKQLVYPTAAPSSRRHRVVAVEAIAVVDPVAVGDAVRFVPAADGAGQIVEVLPRRSQVARRAAGPKRLEQVIVANVDQVVAFVAAMPRPKWRLLDRYLITAEALDLPAVVCFTKADLAEPADLAALDRYRRIGYPVVVTSMVTGEGVEAARATLAGRVSVLLGSSGVGKTSLLNAVEPGLDLRVGEISAKTGKGKHTTSHVELFPLRAGGGVVDAPGMREFGLWAVEEHDLATLFPEFRPHLERCRFGPGCTHTREPGCAVRAAVGAGTITPERYDSYVRLLGGGE